MSNSGNKSPSSANPVPIPGSERAPFQDARDVGAADPKERIQITVCVRPKDESKLKAYIDKSS